MKRNQLLARHPEKLSTENEDCDIVQTISKAQGTCHNSEGESLYDSNCGKYIEFCTLENKLAEALASIAHW